MKSILVFMILFISFFASANNEIIVVNTNDLTMIFTACKDEKVVYQYFGVKLNDYSAFKQKQFLHRPDTQTDFAPELYPAYGGRNYLEPALQVTHCDGVLTTELVYKGHSEKMIDSNISETVIRLQDKIYPLDVIIIFRAYKTENIITQKVTIANESTKPVTLNSFYSSYLPIKEQSFFLTHFHGTWAAEMQMAEQKLFPGIKKIETKKGVRTTQSENPSFLISINSTSQEEFGEVYAGSLAWSGNYSLNFQLDETGLLNVLVGMNPFLSAYTLNNNELFTTPEMIWTYSNTGKGQISRNFHDWSRKYALKHGNELRPIVLNSWEGAYFDFNEKTITDMMNDAADIGIELFVLDDGWFGNSFPRNSDNAGLGDWQVNTSKLPGGINKLAEYAHCKGLQFGIWIEPEMVNPKSDLALKRPTWIVKSGNREVTTLRNQWLLDLSNPEVQDFVYQVFENTINQSKFISYIKWDANRHVENMGSDYLPAFRQSHFWIEYVRGLYRVYEKIKENYPHIRIQLCASGGGRLDYGALKFHDEFWVSDNTNPFDRIFIQHNTNHFFPAIASGSHVSTSPNHQTGVVTPLKFRFDVAMSGRLGLELQPKDLKGEDLIFAKKAIDNYKKIRSVIQLGDLYRLCSPYSESGWASHMYVSKDKTNAILSAFSLKSHERTKHFEVKLKGLSPSKKYRISEINMKSTRSSFWGNGKTFSGEYLMSVGISLNIFSLYDSTVFHLIEL